MTATLSPTTAKNAISGKNTLVGYRAHGALALAALLKTLTRLVLPSLLSVILPGLLTAVKSL